MQSPQGNFLGNWNHWQAQKLNSINYLVVNVCMTIDYLLNTMSVISNYMNDSYLSFADSCRSCECQAVRPKRF